MVEIKGTTKRTFSASIVSEHDWYVAQCLEIDVASQGRTADEALRNLSEALSLSLEPPRSAASPDVRSIEVEISAVSTTVMRHPM